MEDEIYPLTIVSDRYGGSYSQGAFTAWNMDSDDVPYDIHCDDVTCMEFWEEYTGIVGKGRTIEEAIQDLKIKIDEKDNQE